MTAEPIIHIDSRRPSPEGAWAGALRLYGLMWTPAGYCEAKQEELAQRAGVSDRTVRSYLELLEAERWLTRERREGRMRYVLWAPRPSSGSSSGSHNQPESASSGSSGSESGRFPLHITNRKADLPEGPEGEAVLNLASRGRGAFSSSSSSQPESLSGPSASSSGSSGSGSGDDAEDGPAHEPTLATRLAAAGCRDVTTALLGAMGALSPALQDAAFERARERGYWSPQAWLGCVESVRNGDAGRSAVERFAPHLLRPHTPEPRVERQPVGTARAGQRPQAGSATTDLPRAPRPGRLGSVWPWAAVGLLGLDVAVRLLGRVR